MKWLCVYCASSDRVAPKYFEAASRTGGLMAAHGWGLVYGGGKTGLMGAVARGVKKGGGNVIGVIPEFMKARELAFEEADEMITVETMRERKALMEQKADAFLTLPGGWGTLEEIAEILVLRQLDKLRKPCVLFNQDGFYDELLALFRKMIAEDFNKPSNLELFQVISTLDDLFPALARDQVKAETKWFVTGHE